MGSTPWAAVIVPVPTATGPLCTAATSSTSSAAQVPTTSTMASRAPTSWKCTWSAASRWMRPSTSASRWNVAIALAASLTGKVARATMSAMSLR